MATLYPIVLWRDMYSGSKGNVSDIFAPSYRNVYRFPLHSTRPRKVEKPAPRAAKYPSGNTLSGGGKVEILIWSLTLNSIKADVQKS